MSAMVVKHQVDILEKCDHVVIFPQSAPLYQVYPDKSIEDIVQHLNGLFATAFSIEEDDIFTHIDIGLEPVVVVGFQFPSLRTGGVHALQSQHFLAGPLSSQASAAQTFRDFWLDKAELRHVNAEVRECVLWNADKSVPVQIVDFVLKHKVKLPTGCWYQLATQLHSLLRREPVNASGRHSRSVRLEPGTVEELCQAMRTHLMHLNALLPTNVKAIQFSRQELAQWKSLCPYIIMDANVQLEFSGKWPKNPEALHCMRQLFLLRVYKLLCKRQAFQHLPSECRTMSETGFVDVPLKQIVFRIRLAEAATEHDSIMTQQVLAEKHAMYSPLCQLVHMWTQRCEVGQWNDSASVMSDVIHTVLADADSMPLSLIACFLQFLRFLCKKRWRKMQFRAADQSTAAVDLMEKLSVLSVRARETYKNLVRFLLHWKRHDNVEKYF